eukprot:s1346_g2.t1
MAWDNSHPKRNARSHLPFPEPLRPRYDKLQHHPQPQDIWARALQQLQCFFCGAERGWTGVTIHGLRPHTKRTSKCRLWWHVHTVAFAIVIFNFKHWAVSLQCP